MKIHVEHETIHDNQTTSIVIEVEDSIAVATALDLAVEAMQVLTGGRTQAILEFPKLGIGLDKEANQQ